MSKITLFGQIIQKSDRSIFNKLAKEHKTDRHQQEVNNVLTIFYNEKLIETGQH